MAVIDADIEQELRAIEREYADFFDDQRDEGPYYYKIKDMIEDNKTRLIVNMNDIRQKFPKRAIALLQDSVREIACMQRSLKDAVTNVDGDYSKLHEEFFVGFEGSFGQRHVNPRSLKSGFLNNMVCCEGIVTKCSLVRPKVVRSVHYCPQKKKTLEKRYTDLTSFDTFPSSAVYPTEDEEHNPLETEFGLSTYKDHQTFTVQEMPEMAPAGQLPRSADVVADNDLADMCKPGDRVRVIGVYRCLPSKQGGVTSGTFRTVLIANNVQILTKDIQEYYTKEDVETVRKFIRSEKNIFELLARSLAPSIQGHDEIKQAILAMLLGGVEKVLPNGTRLRGDINILLIGDPSVAKSQLLRYVLHTAPRAIATTGRGSSGVGLTAAVTTDPETGDRRLEAGAMVLGDRGVVCIDEFDKMTDIDRTAIHEVMEQGRVTIAKAGIHAKLNARCAVLAAANPVYGRYDDSKTPMENIGMQDSLLSRFDLLFIVLDEHNSDRDHVIAEHVIKMHRYRAPGEEDGAVMELGAAIQTLTTEDLNKEDESPLEVFEKNVAWLPPAMAREKIVTPRFLRKFFALAKRCKPALTEEASAYIAEKYADLRAFDEKQNEKERTMPVTARMLETMIRLSTAFAKSRISRQITERDAEKAYQLLCYACFKEKPKERREADAAAGSKKRRRRRNSGDNTEGHDESIQEDSENTEEAPASKKSKPDDVYTFDEFGESEEIEDFRRPARPGSGDEAAISMDRLAIFKRLIRQTFDKKAADQLPLKEVVEIIQKEMGPRKFSNGEIKAALERMSDDNAIMITEGKIILI